MKILAIDTSSEACSAAVYVDGAIDELHELAPREHGSLILPMIDKLLGRAGLQLGDFDAIAYGRGPGMFTGVRIAASVTQGIAFATGLPVVAISDLAAVAVAAAGEHTADRIMVCIDARMGEVYWSLCAIDGDLMPDCGTEHLGAPETVRLNETAFAAGSGWSAYPQLTKRLGDHITGVAAELLPRASDIARLAVPMLQRGEVLSAGQALPVYLRDEVAWKKP